MSASTEFKVIFTKKNLKDLYFKDIKYKSTVGIDGKNRESFEKSLPQDIKVINRKVLKGTYKFTKYKEKLISKGKNKYPRIVSIPTIRDMLTLKATNELLKTTFPECSPSLHKIVDEVANCYKSNDFKYFLRLDIKDFYPSIRHDILMNKIKNKIKKKEILTLIQNAISQITVSKSKTGKNKQNTLGVPQGLPISNILANLYLLSLDKNHAVTEVYRYFRYVDDILILSRSKDIDIINREISNDCQALDLNFYNKEDNPSKMAQGKIEDGFEYLGYKFDNTLVTVRKESIDKLRESLIKVFTHYRYSKGKNIDILIWKTNLRITGCIYKGTKCGWMFYFSQIKDFKLLHSLDHFIRKMSKRFGINLSDKKFKKFVKTFYEITKNLNNSNYIPNFDEIQINEKKQILKDIFEFDVSSMRNEEVEYRFNRQIYKSIKDLERDLARNS